MHHFRNRGAFGHFPGPNSLATLLSPASKPLTSNPWQTIPMCYNGLVESARFSRASPAMLARHAVLLTPSLSLRPARLPSGRRSRTKVIKFRSLLSSDYTLFHFPYPIRPLLATLTKNAGVCTNNSHSGSPRAVSAKGTLHSSLATAFKFFLFKLLRTLLRFFAHIKNATLLFSSDSALFAQKHPGVGYPPLVREQRNTVGGGIGCDGRHGLDSVEDSALVLTHRSEILSLRGLSRSQFPTHTAAKALRVFASSVRDSPIRQRKQSPREPLWSPKSPLFVPNHWLDCRAARRHRKISAIPPGSSRTCRCPCRFRPRVPREK